MREANAATMRLLLYVPGRELEPALAMALEAYANGHLLSPGDRAKLWQLVRQAEAARRWW